MTQCYSLLVFSARRATELSNAAVDDLVEYFDPDAAILIADGMSRQSVTRLQRELDTRLDNQCDLYVLPEIDVQTVDTAAGRLVFTAGESTSDAVTKAAMDEATPTYIVTDSVSVEVDQVSLSATVDGLTPFRTAATASESTVTVFSTELDADYSADHDGIALRGLSPIVTDGTADVTTVQFHDNGRVHMDRIGENKLGIHAINGIGETYAKRLRQAGYGSVAAIDQAPLVEISNPRGIGETRAERFIKRAQAIVNDEVVRDNDAGQLPEQVVHIDIETDGLTPSIIWQIGVYDGRAGEYTHFVQKDPDDRVAILRDFGAWLQSHLDSRAIVAYNGWTFDFPVLGQFFKQYASEYADVWQRSYRVDPYEWAVNDGNAALPGRTDKLGDVAAALGYEGEKTGLTGAAVAREYKRWATHQSPETEPDWQRHEAYCRDDVLALKHVYDALKESKRVFGTPNTDRPTSSNTSQETLFDY